MAKDDDIRRELEELRAQLEALQVERVAAEEAEEGKAAAEVEADGGESVDVADEQEAGLDVAAHVKELLETLEEELEDSNPKTLLAVFALGVLLGRLLAR